MTVYYMKKRFTIFVVLSAISILFTLIFAYAVCGLAAVRTDFAENVDEMYIDGTDFTPIFKTGAVFLDIFMSDILPVLMYIVFFVVMTLLDLALFGFFRLFGLNGEFIADAEELRLTYKLLLISSLAAAAVTLIISVLWILLSGASQYCLFNLLFCWQHPLFAWAFCFRKLKKSSINKDPV